MELSIEMIDTEQFDDVLREIEVGVDISEGNYDILKHYRDEYQDLLAEVKRLREQLRLAKEWVAKELSSRTIEVYRENIG